jgi:hypothetical protein
VLSATYTPTETYKQSEKSSTLYTSSLAELPAAEVKIANPFYATSAVEEADLPPDWVPPVTPPPPPKSLKRAHAQRSRVKNGASPPPPYQTSQIPSLHPSNSIASESSRYSRATNGHYIIDDESDTTPVQEETGLTMPSEVTPVIQGWFRIPSRVAKKRSGEHIGYHFCTKTAPTSPSPNIDTGVSLPVSWSSHNTMLEHQCPVRSRIENEAGRMEYREWDDQSWRVEPLRLSRKSEDRERERVQRSRSAPVVILRAPRVLLPSERKGRLYDVRLTPL